MCDCTYPEPHTEEGHKAKAHESEPSHACAGPGCPVKTCEYHSPAPIAEGAGVDFLCEEE